jgi:LmbE family N-acetylglucosaminyl deacetylase
VTGLRLTNAGAEVFVPDGGAIDDALARTTDLGVGAHPDDLEFMCVVPIGQCLDSDDRWFTGVTCTDGAGSARGGRFASCSDAEMVAVRRDEQRRAASIGRYGAVVQLAHPSGGVRSTDGQASLVDELYAVLDATRPLNVYTHNPADKHDTHVAVAAAAIKAVRRLPPAQRPSRLVGVEGWRGLDWLGEGEKLRFDATPYADLAQRLAAVFESQTEGAKRYDVAARGRRQANATLHAVRERDDAEEVVVAIDLTPLVRNDELDPVDYVVAAIDRFRADVERARRWFG